LTFSEPLPDNFHTSTPCKRRSCPYQKYFEHKGKLYFTYQCKAPELWVCCRRQIEFFKDPEKAHEPPTVHPAFTETAEKEPKRAAAATPNPPPNSQTPTAPAAGSPGTATTNPPQSGSAEAHKQPQKPERPKPTPEQIANRCTEYPEGCRVCPPVNYAGCGIEPEYRG
jgi:hypothetical protein